MYNHIPSVVQVEEHQGPYSVKYKTNVEMRSSTEKPILTLGQVIGNCSREVGSQKQNLKENMMLN